MALFMPMLFGAAPTLEHSDIAAALPADKPPTAIQLFGALGGGTTPTSVTPTTQTTVTPRAVPQSQGYDTNAATQEPIPIAGPAGTLVVAGLTSQAQTQAPAAPLPPTTPAPVTTGPSDATGGNDIVGRLIDLASQQGAGGGSGGIVALPTGIDSSAAPSSGISKAGIFLIVAIIAIAIYFYSRHKKKKAGEEKGGEKKND